MVYRQHSSLVKLEVLALFQLERGYPRGARDSIPIPCLTLLTQALPQHGAYLGWAHTNVGKMSQRNCTMSFRKAFTIVANNKWNVPIDRRFVSQEFL